MFTWIKDSSSKFKTHLTQLGDEQPVSKAALVVLIFLDFFILFSVFDGLDEHTRQLTSPYEHVTYSCREIVINRSWDNTKRLDNLNDIISSYSNNPLMGEDNKNKLHPICIPFVELIKKIENDKELTRHFENRKVFQREAREIESRIKDRKGGYDTVLLEQIADRETDIKTRVPAIKQDVERLSSDLNNLRGQIDLLDANLNQSESVQSLWKNIQSLTEEDRERLKSDIRTLEFWFPVKQLGMQLIFLFPLFLVIYAWNSTSIRKAWQLQTLVSSHLLVVVSIPILFKIITTVYDIIPKKLLKMVMDLLTSFNLIAIWYYLVIAISIIAALFVIYLFQKKLFSHEKLLEKRISKGLCQKCGKQLPHGSQACSACGFMQYRPCGHCGKAKYVYARYCMECGKPQT
jgi:archaellum component FlaC